MGVFKDLRDYWLWEFASVRLANCLRNEDILDVDQLAQKSAKELMAIPNFGKVCLGEVRQILAKHGKALVGEEVLVKRVAAPAQEPTAAPVEETKDSLLPVHVIMAAYLLREAGWTVTPPPTLQATSPALAPAPRRGA